MTRNSRKNIFDLKQGNNFYDKKEVLEKDSETFSFGL